MNSIQYFDELDSTNVYVKENRHILPTKTLVVARRQTNGKGRGNHTWAGNEGGFYGSLCVKESMVQPATLPLFMAVVAVRTIQQLTGVTPQTKWPNDLLLNGQKISGILCEQIEDVYICGIGINLTQPQNYFTQQNLPYATSLLVQTNKAISVEDMANALYQQFMEAFPTYHKDGFAPFLQAYKQNSFTLGKTAIYGEKTAKAVDIHEDGGLVVQTAENETQILYSGEVDIKGLYGQM